MEFRYFVAATLALGATAALAHTGVKNPAVMARMNGMSAISDNVEVLGTMAKGQVAFDAASAKMAARAIARHSAESVDLFTAQETDPKSEALPAIWENFDDFTSKAQDLEAFANEWSEKISTLEDVRAGIRPLGQSCKACHSLYRE
ncbi:c-type cytochrome [Tateyamaria sp.]|uniref:c-type cytochrome n=1 Tax=Tateyamaria sp. TaxID=1929288 RepID=UPI00329CF62F